MAKKGRSRQSRASAAHRRSNPTRNAPQGLTEARASASRPQTPSRTAQRREVEGGERAAPVMVKAVDFRAEYRYVLADLKRLGILALAMFVLLVVLALIF